MDLSRFQQVSDFEWRVDPYGAMHVPAIIYADEALMRDMDDKVYEQVTNVATLPGIVKASYAMPDAHWGYGFPIGGVAAFDPEAGGVISAGGVGFDISCGVRTMLTGLARTEIEPVKVTLADELFKTIPVGLGKGGKIRLDEREMEAMLSGGAYWAIEYGYGHMADLERIEEHGTMAGARPDCVSARAKERQRAEMGTLGSGNHYLEVQEIAEIFDAPAAEVFGLKAGEVVVSIHCGSRGLGHQIGTDYLRAMVVAAREAGIELPDRELACAPIDSPLGQRYLGAMRAGINCALANREIIGHLTRGVFRHVFPGTHLTLLFDVSHNTCKVEAHARDGSRGNLFVHRKGATRAFGPGHPSLPAALRAAGQPVLIGGSMGTESYVLVGTRENEARAYSSACHGAGRGMSRHQARKRWKGRELVRELADRGIVIRSRSFRGVAEEAPGAYKDVRAVVDAAEKAGLARKVAKLRPFVCIKG
ncbi:MAG: RtcB family protein [Gammaproteobacteria bacterium]|nr:RtcB family protein [Gammaproteobacteria bacterium]NIR88950.1 RtcB family protein [Gammaproteobacteria bacterium]NIU05239.1 RtcB family protein [Gammaproteobacteria bacterium]NIV52854.1 RNA-splicing ligase RtcB [Gammaproteobacteria bacterium]NIW85150.1 RNA-splicing ligase RtcB [Gammaproteobacteria bacterium]